MLPHVTQEGFRNHIAVLPRSSQLRLKSLEPSRIIGYQCLYLALVDFVQELICRLEGSK